jgi:hypothetical protein
MADIIVVQCPKCNHGLRIPADWANQSLRCKFCKTVFQAPKKRESATPPKPPAKKPVESGNPFAFVEGAPAVVKTPKSRAGAAKPAAAELAKGKTGPARARSGLGRTIAIFLGGLAVLLVVGGLAVTALIVLGNALLRTADTGAADQATVPPAKSAPVQGIEGKESGDPQASDPPKDNPAPEPKRDEQKPPPIKDKAKSGEPAGKRNPDVFYPRRALLISVNDYVQASPVAYGRLELGDFKGNSTGALAGLLQSQLDFPRAQIVELSDKAARPTPPVKATIEATVSDFLATSRPQDHVLLLFAGHAAEIGQEAYLVPMDGKLTDPARLIALSWLYDELAKCKARQRILAIDVCRAATAKEPAQPASAMGNILAAKLRSPPAGVEVWSACAAQEQSWESDTGSVFLEMACKNCADLPTGPEHAIPIKRLAARVRIDVEDRLASFGHKQTALLSGKGPADVGPFNAKDPLAPAVAIRIPSQAKSKAADNPALKSILDELSLLPPTTGGKLVPLNPAGFTEVSAKALEPYKVEYKSIFEFKDKEKDFPLRSGLARSILVLQENARSTLMRSRLDALKEKELQVLKKQVENEQTAVAKRTFILKEAVRELAELGDKYRGGENKRIQVLFDYVMLRLKSRVIYVEEYNFNLAAIRSDSLPALGEGENAYRLTAQEKVTINEGVIKEYVKEVKRGWQNIAKNHPDTPYAIVAAREQEVLLGLSWKAMKK